MTMSAFQNVNLLFITSDQQRWDSLPCYGLDFVQAPAAGTYTVVIDKPGPNVYLIAPAAARLRSPPKAISFAPRPLPT